MLRTTCRLDPDTSLSTKTSSARFPRTATHWVVAALCIVGSSFNHPTSANAQSADSVRATADSLVAGERNGLPVEQLVGHMQFVQGNLYGTADRAIREKGQQNRIELLGNVEIHQDTLSLYAPRVTYDGSSGIGHADGGVKLLDRDVILTATSGDYDMNRQAAHFQDHVTITQGTSTSTSDELTYYRSTQTSILTGHAVVKSDSGMLRADKVTYSRALGETLAEGHVRLSNDSLNLHSDWFYNSKPLGEIFARGKVRVEDIRNRTILFGDTLARFAERGYSVVPINPLLLSIDSSIQYDTLSGKQETQFDTMFISSRKMETYQGDSSRFIATDSVKVFRSGFSGIGGLLNYEKANDLLTLSMAKRQHIWYDSTEIDADSLALRLKDRHVNRVFAIGHAFATSPVEGLPSAVSTVEDRIDQLEGEAMTLFVESDTVRQLLDMGSALSIYFRITDQKPDGVNRASGDTIRIDFEHRQVSRLAILSGTEGEYFPEKFVKGRAKVFRLTDFERHLDLMPERKDFVLPDAVPTRSSSAPNPLKHTVTPLLNNHTS